MSNQQPTTTQNWNAAVRQNISGQEYDYIRDLVYQQSRIKLGPHKKELVMARLSKRLRILKLPSYSAYIQFVQSPAGETELVDLIDAISTNHTFFFREKAHFEFMVQRALPELMADPGFSRRPLIKVWSAACSTGEEPYSIGIALSEYLEGRPGVNWRVECTDISTNVLAKAKEAIFASERLKDTNKSLITKYFQKGYGNCEGQYRVKENLRQSIGFQRLNLLGSSYPFREPFDLIFCRNVMIYFDRETQRDLVQKMTPLLRPGGYLFIGHAESLTGINHTLKMIQPAVYQRT